MNVLAGKRVGACLLARVHEEEKKGSGPDHRERDFLSSSQQHMKCPSGFSMDN